MTFTANERPLFTELFGPMVGLKENWKEQGATEAELDFSAFRYRCETSAGISANTGWLGGEDVVLSDNSEYKIIRDAKGRTVKLPKGYATLGLPQDFPVKTMDDWLAVKKHYLFDESRLMDGWYERAMDCIRRDNVMVIGIPGGYDELRELMGDELACISFYDQPELIEDLLQTIGDTALKVLERVSEKIQIDVLSVHEDFAGKNGPLVGPEHFRQFIAPYYRRIWDFVASKGARLFDIDSDGNIDAIIPALLDAGINCIHPFESAAGMDIVKVREQYGDRLAICGGLDKFVIAKGKDEIVRELEYKLPPLIATGGCIFGLDHRIPENTSLENYKFYLEKVWQIFENHN